MDDQNYAIFINKLKTYYSTKGVNLNYIPKIGNEPINLYKLYNVVQALGGVIKVNDFNKWDIVYEEYGLPKSCVNGCFLIKQVYRRYLEAFDKQIKGDNVEVQEDIQLRLNPYKSQFPLSYIYPNHYQIRPNNDTSKLCYAHPSTSVLQSLLSGFPNEEDFAINLISKVASKECLLDEIKHFPSSKKCLDSFTPSERKEFIAIQAFLLGLNHLPKHDNFDFIHNLHKGKQITLLSKAKGLLDILIAHLGLYSNDNITLEEKDSCFNTQINNLLCEKKENFNKFWECSLDEEGITYFSIKRNIHGITPKFCDFYNPNLCYEKEILRLQQIAEIFRNWSFIETNAQIMVKNHLFFKFIFLAIHCTIGNVKTLALDTLANVSKYINLTELPVSEKTFLFSTLELCTHSPDRLIMVRGLEILGNLCFTSGNLALLCNEFSPTFFGRLLALLTISDILIICRTLETLYQISFMGEDLANMLASIPGCIETLINFLTLESGNLMPKPKKSALLLAPPIAVNPTLDSAGVSSKYGQAPPLQTPIIAAVNDFKDNIVARRTLQHAPQAKHSPVTPLRMREIAKLPDNISVPPPSSMLDHSMNDEPKSLVESLTQAKLASRTALAEHFEASRFAEKWFISYYEETDHGCFVLRADVLNSYYVNGRRLNNTFRPLKYTSLCNCIKRAFPNAKYSRKLKQASKQLQVIIHGIKKRTIPLTLEEASKIHATHQNWRQLGRRPSGKSRHNPKKPAPICPPPTLATTNIPALTKNLDVEIKIEIAESPQHIVPILQFPFAQNNPLPYADHPTITIEPSKMPGLWSTTKISPPRSCPRRIYNYAKVVKKAKFCLNNCIARKRRPPKLPVRLKERLKAKARILTQDVSTIAQPTQLSPTIALITGSDFNMESVKGDYTKPFESPLLQARLLMTNSSSHTNQQCNITNGFCESDDPRSSISPRNLTTTTSTQQCPIQNHLDLSLQNDGPSTHDSKALPLSQTDFKLPKEDTYDFPIPNVRNYEISGENCEPEPMELELDEISAPINKGADPTPDHACKITSNTTVLNGSSCYITSSDCRKSPALMSSGISHTVNGICAPLNYLMCRERMVNDSIAHQASDLEHGKISSALPKNENIGEFGGGGDVDVAKSLNDEIKDTGSHPLMNGPLAGSGDFEEPLTKDDNGKDEMDIDVNINTGSNQIICNAAPIPILTFPNAPQPEVKPFNAIPISQLFSEIKVPPPPLIQLFKCGWANCECTFEKLKSVLSHVYFTHAQKPGGCYWFPCVGRVYRQKLSLATHLQEVHCLPQNLQVIQGPAATQQSIAPSPTIKTEDVKQTEEAQEHQQKPIFNPPDQTAIQAIRKHFNTTAAPHLFQYQEDSVTKSIRLIAALILRNLTKNSPRIGKKIIKAHESYLSLNAMNATEASSVLSQILWEINQ